MKKPIYFLLGILLLFVIIYFLLIQKEKKTFTPGKVENLLELDSASVNKIEFKKFDTQLVFQKVNQLWYIIEPDTYLADNNVIGQLLGAASHLEVGEVISSNPEKQPLFQVDDFTGTTIGFFAGEHQLASVILGKMSSDFLHAYLRKTNSDDVYLAQGVFTSMTERKVDAWKNRNMLTLDPKQIQEIEFNQDQEIFKLTKQDSSWNLSLYPYQESSPANEKLVDDFVQSLIDMPADEFARKPEIEEMDFSKPEFSLKLSFLDGRQTTLFVTRKDKEAKRYFVKTDQNKGVFVVFEYGFKKLAKKPEDFLSPGKN